MNMITSRLWGSGVRGMVSVVAVSWMAVASAAPLTVPYTETFSAGAANWMISSTGTLATWNSSGGPNDSAFISREFTITATPPGAFSGPILIRGQDNFNSSDSRFVGNWLTGGEEGVPVATFSVDLRHNALAPIAFQIRFAIPNNQLGASTQNLIVPAGGWASLTVPIINSISSFQSYSGGIPGSEGSQATFDAIFGDMAKIQVGLAPSSVQDPSVINGTFTLDLARPSIAPVPEPSTWLLLLGAAGSVVLIQGQRRVRHG
jgi:hypothetical protein